MIHIKEELLLLIEEGYFNGNATVEAFAQDTWKYGAASPFQVKRILSPHAVRKLTLTFSASSLPRLVVHTT